MKSMAIPTDKEAQKRLAEIETEMEVLISANAQLEQFRRKKIYLMLSVSYIDRDSANQARLLLNALNGSHSQWFDGIQDAIIAMTGDKEDSNRYLCQTSLYLRVAPRPMAQAEFINSFGIQMFDGDYRGWHVAIPDKPSFRLTRSGIRLS